MLTRSRILYLATSEAEPEWDDEYNRWYDEDHLPALCGVPGVICGRIFKAIEGPPRHMANYDLVEPAVQASEAWNNAASRPWTMRMRRLVPDRWRVVYRPIG